MSISKKKKRNNVLSYCEKLRNDNIFILINPISCITIHAHKFPQISKVAFLFRFESKETSLIARIRISIPLFRLSLRIKRHHTKIEPTSYGIKNKKNILYLTKLSYFITIIKHDNQLVQTSILTFTCSFFMHRTHKTT